MKKAVSIMIISTILAAASGFFIASAIGQDNPPKRVVITLRNGEQGPPGPPGPKGEKGDSGATTCPNLFETGEVVINHPGGQVTIYGCIREGG